MNLKMQWFSFLLSHIIKNCIFVKLMVTKLSKHIGFREIYWFRNTVLYYAKENIHSFKQQLALTAHVFLLLFQECLPCLQSAVNMRFDMWINTNENK